MKKKIYVCPKCGRALNFSDNPEYTFQCFECDEDFYMFEAKEMEQPRMEGVIDYTDLVKATMKIQEITDRAIKESTKQIAIKGNDIREQIAEYISETIQPIISSGMNNNSVFRDHARIYSSHLRLNFGTYLIRGFGECQAQLWGENGKLCVYFRNDGKFIIEDRGDDALRWIVEEWSTLKDSMCRMIAYGLKECDKANKKKLTQQDEMSKVINSFRL